MATVYHRGRQVNRALSVAGVGAGSAPFAVAQVRLTGHPTGTLRRTICSFRLGARILSGGGTPPDTAWVHRVFPQIVVQFDEASTANTFADPNTTDPRIIDAVPLRQEWAGPSTSAELYKVTYWTDQIIDTKWTDKGTGTGTNYPTVTAVLWPNDQDVYWGGVFYDHRDFNWQCELSVIYSDSF